MKYTIEEDVYYTSNNCSCCEPDKWTCYKIRKEDGTYVGCEDFDRGYLCYTYHSQQEALEHILQLNGIEVEYIEMEEDYEDQ